MVYTPQGFFFYFLKLHSILGLFLNRSKWLKKREICPACRQAGSQISLFSCLFSYYLHLTPYTLLLIPYPLHLVVTSSQKILIIHFFFSFRQYFHNYQLSIFKFCFFDYYSYFFVISFCKKIRFIILQGLYFSIIPKRIIIKIY